MAALQRLSQVQQRTLAFELGYEYLCLALPGGNSRDIRSSKVPLLLKLLKSGVEELIWLDADALPLRFDQDPLTLLGPNDFQGLALEHIPARDCLIPNTGVWVLRNRPITIAFLEKVIAVGQQPGPLADGGSVMKVLEWDHGDENYVGAHPGPVNEFTRGTCILPGSWNQIYVSDPPLPHQVGMTVLLDPHVLHFAGLPNKEREDLMRKELANLAAPI
jgi:hypothetical protein